MQNIIKNFSPNSSIRNGNIEFIIIHYTEMSFEGALNRLCSSDSKVSSHYLIKETGEIYQLVPDELAAWHAGKSYWAGFESLNNYSIGIELDNLGNGPYSTAQMLSCVELCKHLMKMHNISRHHILGHSDTAPDRKIDPGPWFDWGYLADAGLGMWYDENRLQAYLEKQANLTKDSDYCHRSIANLQRNLQILGYKIEVTDKLDDQTKHVIRAFQMHFTLQKINQDKAKNPSRENDQAALYNLDERSEAILQYLIANKNN